MATLRTPSYLRAWALVIVPLFLALAAPARPQTFSRGVPASVSSPEPDGRQHGIPAGVVSPNSPGVNAQGHPVVRARGPLRRFGPRQPRHNVLVPLPIFYPVYVDGSYQVADPYVPAQPDAGPPSEPRHDEGGSDAASTATEDALRLAYLQGAREAMAQEQDARNQRSLAASDDPPRRKRTQNEEVSAPPKEDNSPSAVFIFKDGHKLETRNFAIMGTTLYDLSSGTVKKVQLVDLDKDATMKANDDRGIQVKLP